MPRAKQLTVQVEDQPGMLGQVASALGSKKVNVQAFMVGVIEGRGAIRVIVDKPAVREKYDTVRLGSGEYKYHAFSVGFSAHWVRLTSDKDCTATAEFIYT